MIFGDTDKNKELLEIYDDVFSGIMSKSKQIAIKKLSSIQMIIYN